jgi:N-acetylglucosamine kinase-like BadF-type ATPase
MILIADSGSTKTAWSMISQDYPKVLTCITGGINPMYQDEESIYQLLKKDFGRTPIEPVSLFFYGAGCINKDVNATVHNSLNRFFQCKSISIQTDLMGAARSLCQNNEGMACILGTGSNSCYYDGTEIIQNVSPLGYMLGDEGSGAVIGRKFIGDLLKNQLPDNIKNDFFEYYNLNASSIMEQVYKKPFPNRFLAQFMRFIRENLNEPDIYKLVKGSFSEFFIRNIQQYPQARHLPVHFTGSVAYYFKEILEEVAMETCYHLGSVTVSPMEGLIRYHLQGK